MLIHLVLGILIASDGSFMVFIERPISAFFILVALVVIVAAFIKRRIFATKIERDV